MNIVFSNEAAIAQQLNLLRAETSAVSNEAAAVSFDRVAGLFSRARTSISEIFSVNKQLGFTSVKRGEMTKAFKDVKYIDAVDVHVYVPLGLKVDLLTYLDTLEIWANQLSDIDERLLKPVNRWLAAMASEEGALTKLHDSEDFKTVNVNKLKKEMSKMFGKEQFQAKPIGETVKRHADWDVVLERLGEINQMYVTTPNDKVLETINVMIEYINVILDKLKEGKSKASNSAAKTLGEMIYQVASEVELYGVLGYQLKVLNNDMDKNLEHIKKLYK